jgi:siroheme synthase
MQVVRGRLDDIAASAAAAEIGPPAVTVIGAVAGLDLWNV